MIFFSPFYCTLNDENFKQRNIFHSSIQGSINRRKEDRIAYFEESLQKKMCQSSDVLSYKQKFQLFLHTMTLYSILLDKKNVFTFLSPTA